MDERRIDRLLEQADRARALGDWRSAIEAVRGALTIDPDHAVAHAALSLALLGARRLHGARIEAGIALGLDGGEPLCHLAMAAVLRGERKLEAAWGHCLVALGAEVERVDAHVLGAEIQELRGDPNAARELLGRALELEADHAGALTALATLELGLGDLDAAERRAAEALAAEPGNLDAHVVAGFIALRRGQLEAAEEHGRFALREDPGDDGALRLWAAIKARRSVVLGLWWRFNAFLTARSENRQVGLLIGTFVAAQLAMIVAGALGLDGLEGILGWAWLGFCAYTWLAPALFRRMLERELRTVTLADDY